MHRSDTNPPDKANATAPLPCGGGDPRDGMLPHEGRNFGILALFLVVLRTGWIFKTESIVIPAVLDSIGGSAALRGWLPLLNRFALSLPPVLFARRLAVQPRKKWTLACCTALMAAAYLVLAAIWWLAKGHVFVWLPVVFLVIYTLFFVATGLNQLTAGTLQGKLIRAQRRGRLLSVATVVGVVVAAASAALLIPRWFSAEQARFECLFLSAGAFFLMAAGIATALAEPADSNERGPGGLSIQVIEAWRVIRRDANFRRLALVAVLFGSSMVAFPHYQALAREQLRLHSDQIVLWVIVQNVGTAIFSMVAGPLADRRGTRMTLRLLIASAGCVPLVAIALAHVPAVGRWLYSLVFVLVGLTPITFRILTYYVLEATEPENHPRYLSTLTFCLALPSLASPLVGRLLDVVGFEAVFCGISMVVLASWCLTFRLIEPRHDRHRRVHDSETLLQED
jgi:MFS family permease